MTSHVVGGPQHRRPAALRVLLCDHRQVVRDALRAVLVREPQFTEVMSAASVDEAIRVARVGSADVIVCHIGLDGEGGDAFDMLEALQYLDGDLPAVAIVPAGAPGLAARALLAGAAGCIDDQQPPDELVAMITALGRRETVLRPDAGRQIIAALDRNQRVQADYSARLRELTDREGEVLRLLSLGYSRSAIAELLQLLPNTVRTHIAHAISKLKVTSQIAAVAVMRNIADLGESTS